MLDIDAIGKSFNGAPAVTAASFRVGLGELVCLLGPSGCGKSTLLRVISGLTSADTGAIRIDGADVTALQANRRPTAMVFQSHALWNHMNVTQNISFGLRVRGLPKAEIAARTAAVLNLVGLAAFAGRLPSELSGGQAQRVALARCLVVEPKVLLMDEPFSALDAHLRKNLREELKSLQRRLQLTTIFVTHDQEEAMSISDRIVVMNGGIAEQVGTPFEIYNQPHTRFVASFVGTLNALAATVLSPEDGLVSAAGQTVTLARKPIPARKGDKVTLALRPEAVGFGRTAGHEIVLPASIAEVHFLGSVIRLRANVDGAIIALDTFNRPDQPPPPIGLATEISFSAADVILLPAD